MICERTFNEKPENCLDLRFDAVGWLWQTVNSPCARLVDAG
jgi:hypothetical protein